MLFGAPRQRQRLQKSKLQMTKTLSRDSVNQRKACVVLWFFSFQDTFISIFFPKCVSTPQSEESSPAQNVATRQTNLQLKVVNKEGLYAYFQYTTLIQIKENYFLGTSPIHEIGSQKICQSPEIKVTIGDAVQIQILELKMKLFVC